MGQEIQKSERYGIHFIVEWSCNGNSGTCVIVWLCPGVLVRVDYDIEWVMVWIFVIIVPEFQLLLDIWEI